MNELPKDIIIEIFNFLEGLDVLRCSAVNTKFNELSKNENLWKRISLSEFPHSEPICEDDWYWSYKTIKSDSYQVPIYNEKKEKLHEINSSIYFGAEYYYNNIKHITNLTKYIIIGVDKNLKPISLSVIDGGKFSKLANYTFTSFGYIREIYIIDDYDCIIQLINQSKTMDKRLHIESIFLQYVGDCIERLILGINGGITILPSEAGGILHMLGII